MSNFDPTVQIPRGWLTRGQIVDLALKKVGNIALKSAPTYMAQAFLNEILHNLYTMYDLPFLYMYYMVDLTVQLGSRAPYVSLPAPSTVADPTFGSHGFARCSLDDALTIFAINGENAYLQVKQLDLTSFNRYVGDGNARGIPDAFHIDHPGLLLFFWPKVPSTGVYWEVSGRFRYQRHPRILLLDSTDDSAIPEFPWSEYLIDALVARCYEFEGDSRAVQEYVKAESRLKKFLDAAHPFRSGTPTIPLDDQVFRNYTTY